MSRVNLRLYCQGIGDCNLVEIEREGQPPFRILIDCGIHSATKGGTEKIHAVVSDLATRCRDGGGKPRLDVIIGTHEHWDHLSGFLSEAAQFKGFDVGEVWLGWTEDPANPQARALDKFKGAAMTAIDGASQRLAAIGPDAIPLGEGLTSLGGFISGPSVMGIAGEKVRACRDALVALVPPSRLRYLEPGSLAALDPVLGVTGYVLGPPHDPALLGVLDAPSDIYQFGANDSLVATIGRAFAVGDDELSIDDDPGAPFDSTEGEQLSAVVNGQGRDIGGDLQRFVEALYTGPVPGDYQVGSDAFSDQSWRRIDSDWLGLAAGLAIQLDSRTNNSSVVLAFELAPGGDVLLFAADAQIGNWRSWPGLTFAAVSGGNPPAPVTGADLLARTVFYKVGHHGSANATRKDGLEAMTSPRLRAFIPTDEAMSKAVHWGDIPAKALSARLAEKTGGRVARADRLADIAEPANAASRWVSRGPGGLYVEMQFGTGADV